MGISMAMVALADMATLTPAALLQALQRDWPDLVLPGDTPEEAGVFSLDLVDGTAFISHMEAPIPWSDLEGPCATSLLWPEAEAVLRAHRMHLVVVFSGELAELERASRLTQVIASVIAACPAASAVFWGDARLVLPAALFRETAVECLPQELPERLWVGIMAGHGEQGRAAGYTRGLDALGLMDIETVSASESPADLYDRLGSIAGYLVEKGLVINDGDTVGDSAEEKIRVVYAPSRFGSSKPVLRLDYDAPKKPFWKFW